MSNTKEKSLELLRLELGSIDLSSTQEDKEMSESERKDYCAAISSVFPRLEKDIKKFLYEQLMFTSNRAEDWDRVIFGRGTFNGMDILLNHWRIASLEHTAKTVPEEEVDKSNPIAEL